MFNNDFIDVAQPLKIEGTNSTPSIVFDPEERKFEIKGNSLSQETLSFYTPVLAWLNDYEMGKGETITLNIELSNYNTDTSRVLLDLLNSLERLRTNENDISVNWKYWKEDSDIREAGMIFSEWSKLPFSLEEIN